MVNASLRTVKSPLADTISSHQRITTRQ